MPFGRYDGPIPLEVLAQFHPNVALAVLRGVPLRPNNRVLQWKFSSVTPGLFQDASFDEQISVYSVFAGFKHTIDPTNAFNGNTFKTLSDTMQAETTGLTMQLIVRGGGDDYTPIPTDIPLQLVERVLNPSIGSWAMWNANNVFGRLTIVSNGIPAAPFTVWAVFSFYQLGSDGARWLCVPIDQARRELRAEGVICCGGAGGGTMGEPPPVARGVNPTPGAGAHAP